MAENYLEISEVQVDGEVYQIADRVAEVGDKVLFYYENSMDRIVTTVTDVGYTAVDIKPYLDAEGNLVAGLKHGAYRVLESVEPSEATEDSPQDNRDVTDLIANLAQEVVKLRKQVEALSERVDSNRDDTVTFAEEFTAFKKEQEFANELFESDIVLLDERTQPEELAETVLGNITIRRSGRGRGVYGGSY